MRLSAQIQHRVAGLKVAQARTRERVRVAGVVSLTSILLMGGLAPFVRSEGTPAYARVYPQQMKPEKVFITEVKVKKVPQYIHRVKVADLEHGWKITGQLTTWNGVTLDRGAMLSFQHVSRMLGYTTPTVSDYRTHEQQAALYAIKPGIAAPPGSSLHERGLAIDLTGTASQNALLKRLLYEHGWRQFSPSGEPWHWSYLLTG